jgi:hypothetical protein
MSARKAGARVVKLVQGSTRGRGREVAVILMVELFQRQRQVGNFVAAPLMTALMMYAVKSCSSVARREASRVRPVH